MDISIIIPVWKRYKELELILQTLNNQALVFNKYLEVILCDSHSGERMNNLINTSIGAFKNLNIIHQNTENIVAAKRNLGISLASKNYLLFLDDDCIPSSSYLAETLNIIQNIKENTIYCGEVRFDSNLVQKSNYYRYRDSKHKHFDPDHSVRYDAWTFVSMNNLTPKKLLIQNNIFYNESFLGYGCEDHEFPDNLISAGISIELSAQKIIHHEHDGDVLKYATKIKCTARDGMSVLLSLKPDILNNNKKLKKIEDVFGKSNIFSKILRYTIFNKFLAKFIGWFLKKTDCYPTLYFPLLFKYVLLCSYIEGINERGRINRNDLKKEWYT